MRPQTRSRLSAALRFAVSIAVFAWIAHKLDWRVIAAFARDVSVGWALLMVASFTPILLLNTRRWQLLLQAQGVNIAFGRAVELSLVGQFFSAFLVGTTGGDVARIVYLARGETSTATAGTSVVLDRLLGLAALSTIVLTIVAFRGPLLASRNDSRAIVGIAVLISIGVLAFLLAATSPLVRVVPRLAELLARLRDRSTLARGYGLGVAGHLLHMLMCYCAARAVHLPVSFTFLISVSPIIALVSSVPVSVQGFGVREAISTVLLRAGGAAPEQAVLFALAILLLALVWSGFGGLVFLRARIR